MLFNSYEFVFGLFPLALLGFFVAARLGGEKVAKLFLVAVSLFFYGWPKPENIWVIVVSVVVNYLIATKIMMLPKGRAGERQRSLLVFVSVVGNLAALGYFKYTNFAVETLNLAIGTEFFIERIAFPLAISFFTFQQIAFVIDAAAGEVRRTNFLNYSLFVTFFPQLLAGPIVHHREMMPQFERSSTFRRSSSDIAVGSTLFLLGLFKKTVFADGIAQYSDPVFAAAAEGESISFLAGWGASIAYTLQIYFGFSGYSDMAVGIARTFGIRLPMNFNSPFKAASMIDFWQRWHITLTRFLTAYLYNPMALSATRRRIIKGRPVIKRGVGSPAAFAATVAIPMILTMGLAGLWHGDAFTYVVWGLIAGFYLAINHLWRMIRHILNWPIEKDPKWLKGGFVFLTFVAIAWSFIIFRAPSLQAAFAVMEGMFGVNGILIPASYQNVMPGVTDILSGMGIGFGTVSHFWGIEQIVFTMLLLYVIWGMPNTYEILGNVMNEKSRPSSGGEREIAQEEFYPGPAGGLWKWLRWEPKPFHAILVGLIAFYAIFNITEGTEFIYFIF